MGTGVLREQSGRGVKLSIHLLSAEVKNEWSYTSVPHICLLGVERYNNTFTITMILITGV